MSRDHVERPGLSALDEPLRRAYLDAMGISQWAWAPRDAARVEIATTVPPAPAQSPASSDRMPARPASAPVAEAVGRPQAPEPEPAPARPRDEPPDEPDYLASDPGPDPDDYFFADSESGPEPGSGPESELTPPPREPDWPALRAEVATCRACALCETRTQTVFGVGDVKARLLIIGEAPGGDEDRQGEPFVGAAGKLLNEMLQAIGLSREQVFIANILKCRPPGNRDPKADEVAACHHFLRQQIDWIRPQLILSVGRISAQQLLASDQPIGRLRGQLHRYGDTGIPLLATYHPAYLLRSPAEKRKVWQDLKRVRDQLRG